MVRRDSRGPGSLTASLRASSTRPASSRGVAPRAQDRGGDPRVSRAVADGRRVHPPLASLARVPLTGKERVHVSIDLNTDSDLHPDADDAVRPDAALAPRRAVERAAELTAENARLRSLDESDARAARAEARLRDALDPSLVALPRRGGRRPRPRPRHRDAAASLQREIQSQDAILREYQRENGRRGHPRGRETPRRGRGVETPRRTRGRRRRVGASSHTPGSRRRIVGDARTPPPTPATRPRHPPRPRRTRDTRARGTNPRRRWRRRSRVTWRLRNARRRARRNSRRVGIDAAPKVTREVENGASLDALRIALEEERARREAEIERIAALRERVEWFTENQRLTTDADETARRRAG